MIVRALLAAVLVLLVTGCSDPTRPPGQGSARYIGVIQYSSQPQDVILVPESVKAGVAFEATVNSFGSSTCTMPDGVDLKEEHNVASITPYDRSPRGNAICTADMAPRPHLVSLRFNAAGLATIKVTGYRLEANGRSLTSIERTITVAP